MRGKTFKVILEWDPEGPGYVAYVPDLPGCFSQGETISEALENIREAIIGHLQALEEQRRMPPPSKERQRIEVEVTV